MGKQVLSTQNTLARIMAPISCSVCAIQNLLVLLKFLMDFCPCDDILHTLWITNKKLLHFKLSKSGQILCIDKTGFPRLGYIHHNIIVCECVQYNIYVTTNKNKLMF